MDTTEHKHYRIYFYYALHIIHREVTELLVSRWLSELTLDPPV